MDTERRPLLLRREIEALIADGAHIFIVDQHVIKADTWIPYHPGGVNAIQHMVGRDATDEVTALHSADAKKRMSRYCIGRIQGRWKNFLPPIQGGKYRKITDEAQFEYEMGDNTSSASSRDEDSRDGSLFDSTGIRNRRYDGGLSDFESIFSSMSSIEDDDGMAHLDSVTREKISLDLEKYPALDDATQDQIVAKYRLLNERIKAEGLYQCNSKAYAIELSRYLLLFASMLVFLHWGWFALSGICMGAFWHQLVFTAHDAGHMGITHHFHTDTVIGIFIADFMGGLSIGWWKRNHNVHHIVTKLPPSSVLSAAVGHRGYLRFGEAVEETCPDLSTDSPDHDPDVEYLPLIAISHRFFHSLRSSYYERIMEYDSAAKFLVKFQKYMYYPVMLLGRFNLYRLSWEYLLGGKAPRKGPAWWHRHLEIVGQIFFWSWYGYGIIYRSIPSYWGRFTFFMISHMVVAPLHVQITLSHFAMSTADIGPQESFPQKMLRTTMDVVSIILSENVFYIPHPVRFGLNSLSTDDLFFSPMRRECGHNITIDLLTLALPQQDCPQWLDFFHGGLQFQAIHHLYPRIPRHNLRRTQKLVQEFCIEVGIPYALYGFVASNKQVIGRLAEVTRQAAILAKCQDAIARSGDGTIAQTH